MSLELRIRPTPQVVELPADGQCRVWTGTTASGAGVVALVARVGVPEGSAALPRLEAALAEARVAGRAVAAFHPSHLAALCLRSLRLMEVGRAVGVAVQREQWGDGAEDAWAIMCPDAAALIAGLLAVLAVPRSGGPPQ